MSTLKISQHSDVLAALDLVKEEVEKEAGLIYDAGGDALKAGHVKPATEAIAYAKKLRAFVKKIQSLGADWAKLEAKIDAAAPEVQEIVRLPHSQRPRKTGYTRKVTAIAPPSNFSVRFPDGELIADKKARGVLAKSIEKLGPAAVAAQGVLIGGEPLVTQDWSLFKKYPKSVYEIKGGWFVKTHSGTKAKIGYVTKVAQALGVKVVIEEA